jgi:hypothetical protein
MFLDPSPVFCLFAVVGADRASPAMGQSTAARVLHPTPRLFIKRRPNHPTLFLLGFRVLFLFAFWAACRRRNFRPVIRNYSSGGANEVTANETEISYSAGENVTLENRQSKITTPRKFDPERPGAAQESHRKDWEP